MLNPVFVPVFVFGNLQNWIFSPLYLMYLIKYSSDIIDISSMVNLFMEYINYWIWICSCICQSIFEPLPDNESYCLQWSLLWLKWIYKIYVCSILKGEVMHKQTKANIRHVFNIFCSILIGFLCKFCGKLWLQITLFYRI